MLKIAPTAIASVSVSALTPAPSTALASPGVRFVGRSVIITKNASVAFRLSEIGAAGKSASDASTDGLCIAFAATAPWAPSQKARAFHFATRAAINSRSPTLHGLGPRIVACVQAPIGRRKSPYDT